MPEPSPLFEYQRYAKGDADGEFDPWLLTPGSRLWSTVVGMEKCLSAITPGTDVETDSAVFSISMPYEEALALWKRYLAAPHHLING